MSCAKRERLPLSAAAEELSTGRRSVRQFAEARLDHAAAVEPAIHSLMEDSERVERLEPALSKLAGIAAEQRAGLSLFGIPIGVKDIIQVDGFPTTAGSNLPPEALGGPEATLIRRLREAGAYPFAKTVTTEFAFSEPGPTRNPHGLDHTPGGSSSGSAAAVSAGIVPAALGTQTVGSVIRPAAFCGVFGFKPTYGRVPMDGVIPFSLSVDTLGWFTQDAAGLGLLASVLADDWQGVAAPRELPRIGIPTGPYLDQASPEALERVADAVAVFRASGIHVEEIPFLSDLPEVAERHQTMIAFEMAEIHAEWGRQYLSLYRPKTAEILKRGSAISRVSAEVGVAGRLKLRAEVRAALEARSLDLFLCPPAVGEAPRGLEWTGDPCMNLPWSHAGVPAATIPFGLGPGGLPLGLQLIAADGDDERLLGWVEMLSGMLSE